MTTDRCVRSSAAGAFQDIVARGFARFQPRPGVSREGRRVGPTQQDLL